jgi:hypothetical protein
MTHIDRMKWVGLAAILAMTLSAPVWAASAITSNAPTVTLQATQPESISVTLGSISQVNFTDLSALDAGDNAVTWTTNWNLDPTAHPTVNSCVYFASSTALTGGVNSQNIPTTSVKGQPGATGSFSAITGSACGQSNALQISTTPIVSGTNNNNGSKSDSVALEVDPTGLGLAPGTYNGTLYIVSVAETE